MRSGVVSSVVLAALVALAVGLVFLRLDSGDSNTATSADTRPTSARGKTTHTLQGALNQAREIITSAPPYVVHDIEAVSYVDTTVGQARALFDPEGVFLAGEWFADAEEALKVWAIVATGDFQTRPAPGSGAPRKSYSAVWIVFAQGEDGRAVSTSLEMIDLSSLGTVVEVPVPLAEYPTPVRLE